MNLQRLVHGGRWHAPGKNGRTACDQRIPLTAPPELRDIDLVDSNDRCRSPKCVNARATQRP